MGFRLRCREASFFRIVTFSKFSQTEVCYQIMAIRELLLIKPQTFDKLHRNYTVAFTMKKKGIEMVQAYIAIKKENRSELK
jgi:hypothetical protein